MLRIGDIFVITRLQDGEFYEDVVLLHIIVLLHLAANWILGFNLCLHSLFHEMVLEGNMKKLEKPQAAKIFNSVTALDL
jgi:hypothetical protein